MIKSVIEIGAVININAVDFQSNAYPITQAIHIPVDKKKPANSVMTVMEFSWKFGENSINVYIKGQ